MFNIDLAGPIRSRFAFRHVADSVTVEQDVGLVAFEKRTGPKRICELQCRTEVARFPGDANGNTVSGNSLAILKPRIDVAPKSKVDVDIGCFAARRSFLEGF